MKRESHIANYVGLRGLQALYEKYEKTEGPERLPLKQIIGDTLPALATIVKDMQTDITNPDSLQVLFMVLQMFYKFNSVELTPALMEPSNMDPWLKFLVAVLDSHLSEE